MMLLSQPPLSTRKCSINLKLSNPNSPPFSKSKSKFIIGTGTRRNASNSRPLNLTLAKADGTVDSNAAAKQPTSTSPPFNNQDTVFVTQENFPLEGVIQFDKPDFSSRINKWGRVALLAGGDVLALFLFSAVGRFNHGFSVFDVETLRTADPFIAGWFLSAYFLGGFSEDGRGMNGQSKAVLATAKSWALGIPDSMLKLIILNGVIAKGAVEQPSTLRTYLMKFHSFLLSWQLGLIIRSVTSGHIPPYAFILVTMGSTAALLIGWRALLFSFLPNDNSKKNDVYRRGNPFELFEV
ncbi:hypothetical protein Pint_08608 [Pistacia integerrima]|uniref:Uncharacterized protein n=1 Tax=Pistacia integerrima TaxID=434235 RepID=A0ACC0XVN8_9ROSI|nr:hypothetical protein Pint_08608 [Pistacia integerrima]